MTQWMDRKLDKQAETYVVSVKNEVANQLAPVNHSIQHLTAQLKDTTNRIDVMVSNQEQAKKEWEDFKTNILPSLASAASS